jgi:hypothetical protein
MYENGKTRPIGTVLVMGGGKRRMMEGVNST